VPDYVKQVWADNDATKPPSAARFNYMEDGIDKASIPTKDTALPGAPYDGQEVYFEASASLGVYWHLRYRSASASTYKWEFLGGPPLYAEVLTSESTTSTTYVDLATVGPSLTLPLAGEYEIVLDVHITPASNPGWAAVKLGTASTSDTDGVVLASAAIQGSLGRTIIRTLTVPSAVVKVQYRMNAAGSMSAARRNLSIRPVRVI